MKNDPEHFRIYQETLQALEQIESPLERARLAHELVDHFNQEVFSQPIVKTFSPCKAGCAACCFTQISVNYDEAKLLASLTGEEPPPRLWEQHQGGNDFDAFNRLPYASRRCIFLDNQLRCTVYQDRPSVCRTNAVLGDASQCDTSVEYKPHRLILTTKADMVIYASFVFNEGGGSLGHEVGEELKRKDKKAPANAGAEEES